MILKPWHKTLDRWFHRYIRLRDTPGPCCTCGKYLTFDTSECGHFITRDKIATRWDERNAHAQCKHCNSRRKGEQGLHLLEVDKRHGEGTAEELIYRSRHPASMPEFEARQLIERFKKLCKEYEQ